MNVNEEGWVRVGSDIGGGGGGGGTGGKGKTSRGGGGAHKEEMGGGGGGEYPRPWCTDIPVTLHTDYWYTSLITHWCTDADVLVW